MSEPRKPSAGFWITVALVAVLVGYPLSHAPVMWWLWPKLGCPRLMETTAEYVYLPLYWALDNSPECLQEAFTAHRDWWQRLNKR